MSNLNNVSLKVNDAPFTCTSENRCPFHATQQSLPTFFHVSFMLTRMLQPCYNTATSACCSLHISKKFKWDKSLTVIEKCDLASHKRFRELSRTWQTVIDQKQWLTISFSHIVKGTICKHWNICIATVSADCCLISV